MHTNDQATRRCLHPPIGIYYTKYERDERAIEAASTLLRKKMSAQYQTTHAIKTSDAIHM
jgi:hypothetical protein